MIEKKFNTGSLTLNYMEGPPNGPPLLLLHALAGRWQTFYYLIPKLIIQDIESVTNAVISFLESEPQG